MLQSTVFDPLTPHIQDATLQDLSSKATHIAPIQQTKKPSFKIDAAIPIFHERESVERGRAEVDRISSAPITESAVLSLDSTPIQSRESRTFAAESGTLGEAHCNVNTKAEKNDKSALNVVGRTQQKEIISEMLKVGLCK